MLRPNLRLNKQNFKQKFVFPKDLHLIKFLRQSINSLLQKTQNCSPLELPFGSISNSINQYTFTISKSRFQFNRSIHFNKKANSKFNSIFSFKQNKSISTLLLNTVIFYVCHLIFQLLIMFFIFIFSF